MGPGVSDADYARWVAAFDRAMAQPSFDALRAKAGLYPFAMTGPLLTDYIARTVRNYQRQASGLGLLR